MSPAKLKQSYRNLSIKQKISLAISTVMVLAILGYSALFYLAVQQKKDNLVEQGKMLLAVSKPRFVRILNAGSDSEPMNPIESLSTNSPIDVLALYDPQGRLLVKWQEQSGEIVKLPTPGFRPSVTFQDGNLHLFQPLIEQGSLRGIAYCRISTKYLYRDMGGYIFATVLTLAVMLLVVFYLINNL